MKVRCGERIEGGEVYKRRESSGVVSGAMRACFADTMRCDAMSKDGDSRSRRPFTREKEERR